MSNERRRLVSSDTTTKYFYTDGSTIVSMNTSAKGLGSVGETFAAIMAEAGKYGPDGFELSYITINRVRAKADDYDYSSFSDDNEKDNDTTTYNYQLTWKKETDATV